ncbi:MAG: alginate lyase family protein [Nannocystaceae bacterium]
MHLPRLARTVSRLRPRQIVGQVVTRARAVLEDEGRVESKIAADGALPILRWSPVGRWLHPDGEVQCADAIIQGRLRFVGIEVDVGYPPRWHAVDGSRLWLYNLHYHNFLYGLTYHHAREVVLSYLGSVGAGRCGGAWESYPLSQRILSWCSLFFGRWHEKTLRDVVFSQRLWLELRRMAYWLRGHLETHLMANHLLENAFALSLAGAAFGNAEAMAWRSSGLRLLRRELKEQVLGDGGHYERSPMYQQRILFGLGQMLNTGDPALRELCREPAAAMAGWLDAMIHPDGGISLFNDAARGVYPSTAVLLRWLLELRVSPARFFEHTDWWVALRESGYFAGGNDRGDWFVMDVGEIGPDYQPGHAHADFLSIEASFGGVRCVVDGGNKTYEDSPERAWARSVEAHSTVFVAGEQPLELWGAFRVGRRGRPVHVSHRCKRSDVVSFRGGHTGYRHLAGSPIPQRRATWHKAGLLGLKDTVACDRAMACISQLRIDREWEATRFGARSVRLWNRDTTVWVLGSTPIEWARCRSYSRFGEDRAASLLSQKFVSGPNEGGVEWVVCRESELARAPEPLAARAMDEVRRYVA